MTKDYIKMCEKAGEIQKLIKFKMGDLFIHTDYMKTEHFIVLEESIVSVSVVNTYKKEGVIWLPTQEQLQEIIFYESVGVQTITSLIEQFSKSDIGCDISITGDMNELWLAFVMKYKYNKTWNGDDWE